jgi:pimeloyl-ACP methyl ester carboxylesterase
MPKLGGEPKSAYVQVGSYEIHVTYWGNPKNPPLVMWHGMARNGRDFDEAACALSDTNFVICPDTLGRGLSSWAKDPADYSYASFGAHADAILTHFGVEKTRWLGTSMGGLIGVTLAAGRLKGRITHLAVNDIGPSVPQAAVDRIASYVGNVPFFDTVSQLEGWLRRNYAPFGYNTDAYWRRMADNSYRRADDGRITVHYDPKIVAQFTLHKSDIDCWAQWDSLGETLQGNAMLIRGEISDVLPKAVAQDMIVRGPRPDFFEYPAVGHAPTLTTEAEIGMLREFFDR